MARGDDIFFNIIIGAIGGLVLGYLVGQYLLGANAANAAAIGTLLGAVLAAAIYSR